MNKGRGNKLFSIHMSYVVVTLSLQNQFDICANIGGFMVIKYQKFFFALNLTIGY